MWYSIVYTRALSHFSSTVMQNRQNMFVVKYFFDCTIMICESHEKFDFQIQLYTVFPRIVSAETILFWKLDCDHYSREETIQGRKLIFYSTFCTFSPLNNGRKYYYKRLKLLNGSLS